VGDAAAGYFVASRQLGEYKREIIGLPPDWEKYEKLEQEYQRAEEDRLLYVATTRAMQFLIISRYPDKPDKGSWKDLYPYLDKLEDLKSKEAAPTYVAAGTVKTEDFSAGKEHIAAIIATCKIPSYEIETVTRVSKPPKKEMPFSEDTGRGMSFGRVVHKMLETVTENKNIDLDLFAENLLKEEERSILDKESVLAIVRSVMSSELWSRMKKAEKALVEVPFSLKVDDERIFKIVSGVIDLAFKEQEGWVIADYKTDKVNGNLDGLITYYRPQVNHYKKFWQEISKEQVKESILYFVDVGKSVVV
jgi:ATP-dependent helicase/nuclease subunit A